MLRKLGTFERALYLSDQHAPFNVVSVLHLKNPPTPAQIENGFAYLQARHPFLKAVIRNGGFRNSPDFVIPIKIYEALSGIDWMDFVNNQINEHLDPTTGLLRCVYLYRNSAATLILTIHHAILDSASGVNLLDELLNICAGNTSSLPKLDILPPVEERFPPDFKGPRGVIQTIRYMISQIGDEIQYRWHNRNQKEPPVQLGSKGFGLHMVLQEELVDRLSRQCRVKGVTLNSLLNATILLSTNRVIYEGVPMSARTFSFADLRPYTEPPTSTEGLANYISMLRYTAGVSGNIDLWSLAKDLHIKIYKSLKRGDKYIASKMGESLIKMMLGLKSIRMGATALNHSGSIPLKPKYGDIRIDGLKIFISAFDLGPMVNAQARIFNNDLCMDFTFLESDMDHKRAEQVVDEIKSILETAAGGDQNRV